MFARRSLFVIFVIIVGVVKSFLTGNSGFTQRIRLNALSMTNAKRIPIIAGNWKMNTDLTSAVALAKELVELTRDVDPSKVELAVFPPYPFLVDVGKAIIDSPSKIQLGAQNVFFETKGAFTGAVSIPQIKSCGCHYCLVGHSERRLIFKENDHDFNLIVKKVHESGMTPILCIGETKEEYEMGLIKQICTIQLARDLVGLSPELVSKTVIAYEPVWAIGTGLSATPEIAQSAHDEIRSWFRKVYGDDVAEAVRIQYGGSVTADNVDSLMKQPDIDGALVGGASLTASTFSRIAKFQA